MGVGVGWSCGWSRDGVLGARDEMAAAAKRSGTEREGLPMVWRPTQP